MSPLTLCKPCSYRCDAKRLIWNSIVGRTGHLLHFFCILLQPLLECCQGYHRQHVSRITLRRYEKHGDLVAWFFFVGGGGHGMACISNLVFKARNSKSLVVEMKITLPTYLRWRQLILVHRLFLVATVFLLTFVFSACWVHDSIQC